MHKYGVIINVINFKTCSDTHTDGIHKEAYKEKSNVDKSGELGRYEIGPPRPIHLPVQFSSKILILGSYVRIYCVQCIKHASFLHYFFTRQFHNVHGQYFP